MDLTKFAKVLAEAKDSGLLEAALAALSADPDRLDDASSVASWEEVGAMTDACKRRSLAMDGSDRPLRAGALGYGSASPGMPSATSDVLTPDQWQTLESRGQGLVPPGVTMKEWADTLLDFRQVQGRGIELCGTCCFHFPSQGGLLQVGDDT